jgi:hypothetical protein
VREDAANIALVLNDLEHRSNLRRSLVEKLKNADESIEDFSTRVLGGTIQLFLHYSGLKSPVPATRLSDGTVRYLCLLAVLCHPSPPPLVCLEEPELGLHPDLLPGLADLLVEASHRMQLIVTTHSDVLVDGLTKVPEAVIVCEKRNGQTVMARRTSEELAKWMKEDYGLGQLSHENASGDDFPVLLVDSEEAVIENSRWEHVRLRPGDKWPRPAGASEDQIQLMVQAIGGVVPRRQGRTAGLLWTELPKRGAEPAAGH